MKNFGNNDLLLCVVHLAPILFEIVVQSMELGEPSKPNFNKKHKQLN